MEFLALMVALGVYAYRGDGTPVQHDAWHRSLRQTLAAWMSGQGLDIAAIVLPVLLLELAYLWLGGVLGGLPEFVLLVLVLLYSLGRGNLGAAVAGYLERWSRGDFQAAHQVLMDDPVADTPDTIDNPSSLHAAARRRLCLSISSAMLDVPSPTTVAGCRTAAATTWSWCFSLVELT